VIENRLQMAGVRARQTVAERARLIGDQLHRSHDAAPLVVELFVVGADQRQELREFQRARGRQARALELLAQARMQLRDGRHVFTSRHRLQGRIGLERDGVV
jgi:hypothetical protein